MATTEGNQCNARRASGTPSNGSIRRILSVPTQASVPESRRIPPKCSKANSTKNPQGNGLVEDYGERCSRLLLRLVRTEEKHSGKITAECAQEEERKEFTHQEELQDPEVRDLHQERSCQDAPTKGC